MNSAARLQPTNDSDEETPHNELTAHEMTGSVHGTVTLHENGWFEYVPDDNFHGVDSFTYRAFDGELYSDPATVTLNIASINDVPVAMDDSYSVDENGSLFVYAYEGVLANDIDADNEDTDPEDDTLTALLQSEPEHGTLITLAPTGWFTYMPDSDYCGMDSFTYEVFDGTAYSNLATVMFQVVPEEASETGGVPEPSAIALLATVVLGVVAFRRHKRSR